MIESVEGVKDMETVELVSITTPAKDTLDAILKQSQVNGSRVRHGADPQFLRFTAMFVG